MFEDWSAVSTIVVDDSGEGCTEDFADLEITNYNDFLFLKFSFNHSEYLLQDLNTIHLYIDTDNNNQTGFQIHGVGAELQWCFGCRAGTYHSSTGSITIRQADIVLRSAPTITSQEFEMALGLGSVPMTLGSTQTPDTISIVLGSSDGSDMMPDIAGSVRYKIDWNNVELSIYNIRGQKVSVLISEKQNPGYHQAEWDATGFASGIYYYMIRTGNFQDVKRMILVR